MNDYILKVQFKDGSYYKYEPWSDLTPIESVRISQLMIYATTRSLIHAEDFIKEFNLMRHFVMI